MMGLFALQYNKQNNNNNNNININNKRDEIKLK